jgi:hypothetical protein
VGGAHVEQFPHINKLCNVATCWIYKYIGILLAHHILHISRIRVNVIRIKFEEEASKMFAVLFSLSP